VEGVIDGDSALIEPARKAVYNKNIILFVCLILLFGE